MFGLSPDIVAWLAFSIFAGALAKGISGVALPIVTLSIALNFVEPRVGLALVSLPIVLTNTWQAFGGGDFIRPLKRFWPVALMLVIGLYIGSELINVFEAPVLFAVMGITAIVFTVSQFYKPDAPPLRPRTEKILGPFVGIVSGLMGGMTSVWGPPIMMFLFMLKMDKDMWVRSITGLYLLGGFPLMLFYLQNGVLGGDMLWLSVAACIPGMAGIVIGERLRRFINEALFRKLLLATIFVFGLNMIRRALIGM